MLGHVSWRREVRVTPFMRWLDHGIQFDYPASTGSRPAGAASTAPTSRSSARCSSGSAASTRSTSPTATRTSTSPTAPRPRASPALQPRRRASTTCARADLEIYRRGCADRRSPSVAFVQQAPRARAATSVASSATTRARAGARGARAVSDGWFPRRFPLLGGAPGAAPTSTTAGARAHFLAAWAEARSRRPHPGGARAACRSARAPPGGSPPAAEVVDAPGGSADREHVVGQVAGDDRVGADEGAGRRYRRRSCTSSSPSRRRRS